MTAGVQKTAIDYGLSTIDWSDYSRIEIRRPAWGSGARGTGFPGRLMSEGVAELHEQGSHICNAHRAVAVHVGVRLRCITE